MEKIPSRKEFDAIIYIKSGKYHHINEREGFIDILQFITGLNVSAGAVILTKKKGAIFVDGRYALSARLSVDKGKFDVLNLDFADIIRWISEKLPKNSCIAYDPRYFSKKQAKKIKNRLENRHKFTCIDIENTFSIPKEKRKLQIYHMEPSFLEDRLSCIYEIMAQNNLDAYLICDPASISWILNVRDLNSKYALVVFGYLLATKDHVATLYIDELYSGVASVSLQRQINLKLEHELQNDLKKFGSVGIDESKTPSYLEHDNFINIDNLCAEQKSVKNAVEISNMMSAAKKDSAVIINFLHWLHKHNRCLSSKNISPATKSPSELQIAEKILYFRKCQKDFVGESFPCIAAADEHSSIVHYSPTEESNAYIKSILLLDSGGQYKYGTTDITRTICLNPPTDEQKLFYTLVLKGHIAVANAKIPVGSTGAQLDPLARQFLWKYLSDYNHATGHGIGYMSHVHESPAGISKNNNTPLKPGMILSNEPGYYKDNCFGIRLENMMLIRETGNFLWFETISLVPFDMKFIDKKLLTTEEIAWINDYHKNVISNMKDILDSDVFHWLEKNTYLL